MGKKYYVIILLVCGVFAARAQYAPIPDRNFGKWLYENGYSSCLKGNSRKGWQLDTTNAKVTHEWVIKCRREDIRDLEGIQYFKGLHILVCSTGYQDEEERIADHTISMLARIPALPDSLRELTCGQGLLDSLPTLPSTLRKLKCVNNHLRALPLLPLSLEELDCGKNMLRELPVLPPHLWTLLCGDNDLSTLPDLPSELDQLACDQNHIISLPALPDKIRELYCSNNELRFLPALPSELKWLYCDHNKLRVMPPLPYALTDLYCSDNELGSLGPLPAKLMYMDCSCNFISYLGEIHGELLYLTCDHNLLTTLTGLRNSQLRQIDCSFNPGLHCVGDLPASLSLLDINGTEIQCLPAHAGLQCQVLPQDLPECSPGSIECGAVYSIKK